MNIIDSIRSIVGELGGYVYLPVEVDLIQCFFQDSTQAKACCYALDDLGVTNIRYGTSVEVEMNGLERRVPASQDVMAHMMAGTTDDLSGVTPLRLDPRTFFPLKQDADWYRESMSIFPKRERDQERDAA